jgi:hypothetical protein
MLFFSWLRNRNSNPRAKRATAARPKHTRFRPLLETLEDRWVPSTLTVTNTLDSGAGSLRADIAAAHNGGTIVFNIPKSDPGYNASTGVWTITLTSGELAIKKNLTITGPGAANLTISGNHASRVFEVLSMSDPHVSLSGLTISNGSATYPYLGGGILVDTGATLALSNSTLSGNSAGQGGAINNQGTLTVIGCILTGNSAGEGGAIDNVGGQSILTVSASTLSYNSADEGGGIGGGIANYVGTVTINSGTTLSHNSASQGGGIFNQSGTVGGLTIDGCTISGNSAGNGGGIFDSSGTVTVTNSSTITGNSATILGGGIYLGGNSARVTVEKSSSITGNSAPAGSGADVYNFGVLYVDSSSWKLIGTVDGNQPTPI